MQIESSTLGWVQTCALRVAAVGLTLVLWPVMTAAALADMLTGRDPRYDDV